MGRPISLLGNTSALGSPLARPHLTRATMWMAKRARKATRPEIETTKKTAASLKEIETGSGNETDPRGRMETVGKIIVAAAHEAAPRTENLIVPPPFPPLAHNLETETRAGPPVTAHVIDMTGTAGAALTETVRETVKKSVKRIGSEIVTGRGTVRGTGPGIVTV